MKGARDGKGRHRGAGAPAGSTREAADPGDADPGDADPGDADPGDAAPKAVGQVTRRTALGALIGVTVVILVVDLVAKAYHRYVEHVPELVAVFDVGREHNVASWWNTVLLFGVAACCVFLALLAGRAGRTTTRTWLAPAVIALLMSLDESVEIHERLGAPIETAANNLSVDLPTYAWVLPGVLVAAAIIVLTVLWARRLPRDLRFGLLGALALFFTGAIVVESLTGWLKQHEASVAFVLGISLEETLEMSACIVAIAVLTRAVDRTSDAAGFRLRADLR